MKKKQKVISVSADFDGDLKINNLLDSGWVVKKMKTEHVSVGSLVEKGKIVYLLEKQICNVTIDPVF